MNFETDDNSTDECSFLDNGAHRTTDRCAGCHQEIDTTGDPSPTCPLCGSTTWYRVQVLLAWCPYASADCRGPVASVTQHVCVGCLDCVAIYDRVERAALACMCPKCKGVPTEPGRSASPPVNRDDAPAGNPFDTDTDDWL
jgi:hypothetical protein